MESLQYLVSPVLPTHCYYISANPLTAVSFTNQPNINREETLSLWDGKIKGFQLKSIMAGVSIC